MQWFGMDRPVGPGWPPRRRLMQSEAARKRTTCSLGRCGSGSAEQMHDSGSAVSDVDDAQGALADVDEARVGAADVRDAYLPGANVGDAPLDGADVGDAGVQAAQVGNTGVVGAAEKPLAIPWLAVPGPRRLLAIPVLPDPPLSNPLLPGIRFCPLSALAAPAPRTAIAPAAKTEHPRMRLEWIGDMATPLLVRLTSN